MKILWKKLGAWRWFGAGVLSTIVALGGVAYGAHRVMAADGPGGAAFEQRVGLGKDVAKLAIVVMANQTPITSADAQAVLPVLKELRDAKMPISEATAQALDGKLQAAFSPTLKQAVSVVRLPEPTVEQREAIRGKVQERMARGGKGDMARGHMMMKMGLNRLIDFFETAAKG
jgi:hypothetical protein